MVYSGHAAANDKVSVPWTLVCKDPNNFFNKKYLPAGVELQEISKMKSDALQSCYGHWYTRQERGARPFWFKHVDPGDVRINGKKRKPKAASGDSDQEGDEPEEAAHEKKYVQVITLWRVSRNNHIADVPNSPQGSLKHHSHHPIHLHHNLHVNHHTLKAPCSITLPNVLPLAHSPQKHPNQHQLWTKMMAKTRLNPFNGIFPHKCFLLQLIT
jgi:hypothetical protein